MRDALAIDNGDATALSSTIAFIWPLESTITSEERQSTTSASQTPATLTSASIPETPQETEKGDGIKITLRRKVELSDEEGQGEATILLSHTSYSLEINVESDLYIGAVQLLQADVKPGAGEVIDLLPHAQCISNPNLVCDFKKLLPFTQGQAAKKRHRFLNKRQQKIYEVILDMPQLTEQMMYTIQVTWAATQNPALENQPGSIKNGRPLAHYSNADDPFGEAGNQMIFLAMPPGTIDPGVDSPGASTSGLKGGVPPKGGTPASGVDGALPSTLPSSPSATPPSKPSQQISNKGGLSEGEKAGIAVGAVLGVLLLLALIFLCLRRRKSQRKTAGGYYGDAPGSSNDIHEKEAGVGIAAIQVSASPTFDGHHVLNGAAAMPGPANSERVVDGASPERVDMGGHAAPAAGVGAAGVARKPIGSRGVRDEGQDSREDAITSQVQVLSDEERARWEEEERRLDEDIAEAERRRLGQ